MRRPCNRESANKAKSDVRSGESNRKLSDHQAMVSFDRGAVIERSKRKERTCGRRTEKDRRSERDTRVPSSPSPRPAHAATSSLSCVGVVVVVVVVVESTAFLAACLALCVCVRQPRTCCCCVSAPLPSRARHFLPVSYIRWSSSRISTISLSNSRVSHYPARPSGLRCLSCTLARLSIALAVPMAITSRRSMAAALCVLAALLACFVSIVVAGTWRASPQRLPVFSAHATPAAATDWSTGRSIDRSASQAAHARATNHSHTILAVLAFLSVSVSHALTRISGWCVSSSVPHTRRL